MRIIAEQAGCTLGKSWKPSKNGMHSYVVITPDGTTIFPGNQPNAFSDANRFYRKEVMRILATS